nr:MAG TPA: hypothetical protein [Bacteriophage sp.]
MRKVLTACSPEILICFAASASLSLLTASLVLASTSEIKPFKLSMFFSLSKGSTNSFKARFSISNWLSTAFRSPEVLT